MVKQNYPACFTFHIIVEKAAFRSEEPWAWKEGREKSIYSASTCGSHGSEGLNICYLI